MKNQKLRLLFSLVWIASIAPGCSLSNGGPVENTPVPTFTSAAQPDDASTPTQEPTPTVEAAAYVATVNGEGILQSSFDASLMQLQQALEEYPELLAEGQTPEERVLQDLAHRAILAQAARDAGFQADEAAVDAHLASITEQAGGEEALNTWLEANGYTLETFRQELPLEIEAAWQRDQITDAVPQEVEQVRAQQILFYDEFQASRAYDQLKAGFAFEQIAANNDAQSLGYLDWVPRGYLIYPELEDVLFSLQPGQFSEVLESEVGYHILYVFERGVHPLSSEARLTLQEQALAAWLEEHTNQSEIIYPLP